MPPAPGSGGFKFNFTFKSAPSRNHQSHLINHQFIELFKLDTPPPPPVKAPLPTPWSFFSRPQKMPIDVSPASIPTMQEIAERAGVGKATVSLALREDPRLRPETRRRIQRVAAEMGYRTNATVANLMAQLRASRNPKYRATLGFLNTAPEPHPTAGIHRPTGEWAAGCRRRAAQLGYGLDPIWLHEPGMTPARLTGILDSRNIRGLVISAPAERPALPERYDFLWRRHPCVVAGSSPASPALNFSTNDHFSTAFHAVERLWEGGWRRIGLVVSPGLDAGVGHRFAAGFWAGQEALGGCGRLPVFPFHPAREAAFHSWYARHRPDAILTSHEQVREWIEESRLDIPGTVGLAHLDRHEGLPDWSGMNQNNAHVGEAAIEMLIGQVHRNETGLPDSPKASFIRSTWVDGATAERCVGASHGRREEELV